MLPLWTLLRSGDYANLYKVVINDSNNNLELADIVSGHRKTLHELSAAQLMHDPEENMVSFSYGLGSKSEWKILPDAPYDLKD